MGGALVTPKIITWARERAGLDVKKLAGGISTPEIITKWEKGTLKPSLIQAQKIAKKTKIPLGYLYLKSPPNLKLPTVDFRSDFSGKKTKEDDVNIYNLVSSYKHKLEWYEEYLKIESTNFNSDHFLGKFPQNEDYQTIASDIRESLQLEAVTQEHKRQRPDTFLKGFINKCQNFGLWIVRTSYFGTSTKNSVTPEAYSGFALKSQFHPLIWLNSKSFKAVQVFTLAHEIAHLWIGEEGLSNLNPESQQYSPVGETANQIERICDLVASEILVPTNELRGLWHQSRKAGENIDNLFDYFGVSRFVLLNKALQTELINRQTYNTTRLDLLKRIKKNSDEGGGNYYQNLYNRNGVAFSKAVINSLHAQTITPKEAFSLLDIQKFETLLKFDKFIDDEEKKNN